MTRVFTAALATEINTYSPLPVDLESFREHLLARPGEHPERPSVVTGPIVAARRHAPAAGWTLIEGTCASAAPGGPVNRATYEALRDEILRQLERALPLDAAIFGLHGAMVAHGYDDCEGDLLQRARAIVGQDVLIAAEFDPHCHWTKEMAQALDIAVFYKEFPHVDFYERAEELIALVDRTLKREIAPRLATYDCRMIDVLPTSREPMQGFVEKIRRIECCDERVLSISVVHGFRAADVPEMGSKVVVVADGDHAYGHGLAKALARELFDNHGRSMPPLLTPEEAIAKARACPRLVVLADIWGNPGGGVPGDNTVLLKAMIAAEVENAAFATIWDPMAVRVCHAAGEGARIKLRFGGKSCAGIGDPIDAEVVVSTLQDNATQTFVDAVVSLGPSAVIQVGGIEVVLNSFRTQPFEPTIFTNLGIPATERDILVVKSTTISTKVSPRSATTFSMSNAPASIRATTRKPITARCAGRCGRSTRSPGTTSSATRPSREVGRARPIRRLQLDEPERRRLYQTLPRRRVSMTVKRIVANIAAEQVDAAHAFYGDLLGMKVVMDHGWILTFASEGSVAPQLSVATEGGSGTPVPDLSIEVDDLEETYRRFLAAGLPIEYGPVSEPWGVRRFYVRDPFGRLVNVLAHD